MVAGADRPSRWQRRLIFAGPALFVVGVIATCVGVFGLVGAADSIRDRQVGTAKLNTPLTVPATGDRVRVFVDYDGRLPRTRGDANNGRDRELDRRAREERSRLLGAVACRSSTGAWTAASGQTTINQYGLAGSLDASRGATALTCTGPAELDTLDVIATTGGAGSDRALLFTVLGVVALAAGFILAAVAFMRAPYGRGDRSVRAVSAPQL